METPEQMTWTTYTIDYRFTDDREIAGHIEKENFMKNLWSKFKTWLYIGSKQHLKDVIELKADEIEMLEDKAWRQDLAITMSRKAYSFATETLNHLEKSHREQVTELTDQRDTMASVAAQNAKDVNEIEAALAEAESELTRLLRSNAALRGTITKMKAEK